MSTVGKNDFRSLRDKAAQALDKRSGQAIRDAKVRERLDRPFAILAAVGVLALMGGGYFLSVALDRAGAFDPDVVRPLPDDRVLTNLRDSDARFIAGATLGDGEGRIAVLREDGALAYFNESTGAITNSVVDPIGIGLQSPLVALSAGCGRERVDPGAMPCPAPDRVFGLSQNGGIIESDAQGDWRVRLRDAPWIGRDGEPVNQDDVTAWASSADGRHIAVLAGVQGLAIFDQQDDSWTTVSNVSRLISDETLSAPIHLLSQNDAFWLGTAQGLARVSPRGQTPRLAWAQGNMFVRDLEVTAQGDLIALLSGECAQNSASDCLAIETIDGLDQRRVLVGEVEKIATLSDDTIQHAVLQGNNIVVVDQAGIFAYDGGRRTWRTLAAGAVDSFWVNARTGDITATMADALVQVSAARINARRDVQGGPFVQVEVTPSGRILGLTNNGELRDLQTDQILSSRAGAPPENAVFHAGMSVGDRVLLASRTGVLIHDVRAREFQWLDGAALTGNATRLLNRGVELRTSGSAMWVINRGAGTVSTVNMTGSFPNVGFDVSDAAVFASPLRSLMASQDGLFVVDSLGVGATITPTRGTPRVEPLLGDPRSGRGRFTTAASHSDGVLFATASRIWDYDTQTRDWSATFGPPPQETIADISVGDGLHLLSQSGRVYRAGEEGWDLLLGRGDAAQLGLADITDAVSSGGTLYLAGGGIVQTYNLETSAFGGTFGGGQGDVRVVDVVSNRPVWLSNGQLRFGNDLMANAQIEGAWAARDGIVAMVRGGQDQRFAMHWRTPSSDPVCTFMTAPAPRGDTIDAVELSQGRLLVATTTDVGLYDTQQRRWLNVAGLSPTPDLRLYVTDGHLVAVTGDRILSQSLDSIAQRSSCDIPSLALNWTQTKNARNVVFDAQRGQGIILDNDGRVSIWENGAVRQLLAGSNQGPNQATLQQVVIDAGTLVFAANDRIWKYDLQTRLWSFSQIVMPDWAAPIAEVDIASVRLGRGEVTVWTSDDASYQGVWTSGAPTLGMTKVAAPRLAPINTPATDILDISRVGETWIVSSQAQMEFTRQGQDAPIGNVSFPPIPNLSQTPNQLGQNTAFVVGDPASPQRLFILPSGVDLTEQHGTLSALAYDYSIGTDRAWGLSANGQSLLRIDQRGAVLTCDITAGNVAPSGCQQTLAPPLEIERSSVGLVFGSSDKTYAAIEETLYLFDQTRRIRTALNGPTPGGDAVAFRFAQGDFVWDGEGQNLWRIDDDAADLILQNVQRLDVAANRMMLQTASGLFQMTSAAGPPVDLTSSAGLTAVSYDWGRGGDVIGVNRFGMIVAADGRWTLPVPLPSPETIRRIVQPNQDQVWVQRIDGSVTAYVTQTCTHLSGPRGRDGICLAQVVGAQITNPSNEPLLSVSRGARPVVAFETFAISFEDGQFGASQAAPSRPALDGRFPNDTRLFIDQLQANLSGVTELAPAVLARDERRISFGVGGAGAAVTRVLRPFFAMDIGWLKWDRSSSAFEVAAVSGDDILVQPQQFIRGGQLLLDHDGVARSVDNGAAFEWVTRHSIWRLNSGGGNPALVALLDLPEPVGLNDGRLLFAGTLGLAVGAQTIDADVNGTRRANGALSLSSNWRLRRVDALITRTDNSRIPAFATRGFVHDQRESAGWSASGPVLSSGVGLVSPINFSTVLPRPNGTTPAHLVQVNGVGLARLGTAWSSYDNSTARWARAQNPFASRILADMEGMIWRLDQGVLDISTQDPAQAGTVARTGLQFDVDRLRAMAATPSAVMLATGGGTHQFETGALLGTRSIADDSNVPQDQFDALSVSPNDWVIFSGEGRAVWDRATRRWTSPTPARAPWIERRAIATPEIQVDISARGGALARRAVLSSDGTDRWALFEWRRGELMPFDRANALHSEDGTVYIGTDMGLRMIGADTSRSDVFVDASATPAQDDRAVSPVTRVGRPSAEPARPMARDQDGNCLEINAASHFTVCADVGQIDALAVVSNSLWEWSKTPSGLSGAYTIAQRPPRAISNDPTARWPHDTLAVFGACDGAQIEVWEDGTTIREAGVTSDLGASPRIAGHCQVRNINTANAATLESGMYLLAQRGGDVLGHVAPSNWAPVDPQLETAIGERAAAAWAFDADRLRMRALGEVSNIYEFRRLDGTWSTMGWTRGLPEMDDTQAVLSDGATAVRITPMGMIEHRLTQRALEVDPNRVTFRTTSDPVDFASCVPDSVARLDGRAHTLTAQTDAPIVLRCGDGRILQEDPNSQTDVGAFSTVEPDPFATRRAIEQANGWGWTIEDPTPTSAPTVTVQFRDEPVSLAAGRFDLDDYRSLAAPFDDRIDVVAGLGIWAYPASNLALHNGERPADIPDFATVSAVFGDRDQNDGAARICVNRRDAPSVVYAEDGTPRQVEACYEWRGQDAIFQYRHHAETGAQALAVAANGPLISRALSDGQFSDRVAIGAPHPVQGTRDLMVPTEFGVAVLDQRGQTSAVHSHADVLALATLPDVGTAILTRSGVFPVADMPDNTPDECAALPSVLARFPQDHSVQSVTVRGSDLIHFRGMGPDGEFLASARCTDDRLLASSQEFMVGERIRHVATLRILENATETVLIKQARDGSLVLTDGRTRHVRLDDVRGSLIGVYAASQPRAAVILTDGDAYLLDIDAAILALSRAQPDAALSRAIEARPFGEQSSSEIIENAPASPSTQTRPPVRTNAMDPPQEDQSEDIVPPVIAPTAPAVPDIENVDNLSVGDGGNYDPDAIVDLGVANRERAVDVQTRLKALGLYAGQIDGAAGPMTRAAISAYQDSIGAEKTGNLTLQQFNQLMRGQE